MQAHRTSVVKDEVRSAHKRFAQTLSLYEAPPKDEMSEKARVRVLVSNRAIRHTRGRGQAHLARRVYLAWNVTHSSTILNLMRAVQDRFETRARGAGSGFSHQPLVIHPKRRCLRSARRVRGFRGGPTASASRHREPPREIRVLWVRSRRAPWRLDARTGGPLVGLLPSKRSDHT